MHRSWELLVEETVIKLVALDSAWRPSQHLSKYLPPGSNMLHKRRLLGNAA